MKIKTMGASPLTGQIFQGTLNTDTGMWVGKKEDVTEHAVKAVAEHLMIKKQKYAYGIKGGKYLVVSHEIVDSLPDEFQDSNKN
ncbi:hypothetical protein ABLV11_00330 [Klebsiella sp. GW_Kp181]|uniref:DUF7446 family protein n=1 Tax=Klebsiella sp. GW_Kp181 TaxID=3153492 RepID=UPI0032B5C45C|nr:hypothetical protein [Klebsiella oxytoca]